MMAFLDIRFWTYAYANSQALWLILVLPLLVIIWLYQTRNRGAIQFSAPISELKSWTSVLHQYILPYLPKAIFLLALSSLVVAIAEPYKLNEEEEFQKKYSEGIDIVLSLDISLSMLARDFKPNRMEAAKNVAAEFIANRPNDRIGLVVYEGEAYTQCPSTTDHTILLESLKNVEAGILKTNRTAIGMGLGLAVARLRDDNLKSKVVILMSDGVSNAGEIDPITAAQLAKKKGIRVYTIGVGSKGTAPMPIQTPFGVRYQQMPVDIDEEALKEVAQITGGEYFRATDENSLRTIYQTIDEMEKTKVNVMEYRVEPPIKSYPFLLFASILMIIGYIISITLSKRIV